MGEIPYRGHPAETGRTPTGTYMRHFLQCPRQGLQSATKEAALMCADLQPSSAFFEGLLAASFFVVCSISKSKTSSPSCRKSKDRFLQTYSLYHKTFTLHVISWLALGTFKTNWLPPISQSPISLVHRRFGLWLRPWEGYRLNQTSIL